MGEQGGVDGPVSPTGMPEYLTASLHPPTAGPMPIQDLSSILLDPAQHFQLDLDLAPQAIAAFRNAAHQLRDLVDESSRLADLPAPALDAVSINAAKEIASWAVSGEPGSLRWALESGALQMESAADALERSLATHKNNDEVNATNLSRSDL